MLLRRTFFSLCFISSFFISRAQDAGDCDINFKAGLDVHLKQFADSLWRAGTDTIMIWRDKFLDSDMKEAGKVIWIEHDKIITCAMQYSNHPFTYGEVVAGYTTTPRDDVFRSYFIKRDDLFVKKRSENETVYLYYNMNGTIYCYPRQDLMMHCGNE